MQYIKETLAIDNDTAHLKAIKAQKYLPINVGLNIATHQSFSRNIRVVLSTFMLQRLSQKRFQERMESYV